MSLLSKDVSNIPLNCNICPKRPDFSDVSHLLTHVASKGHLSNYYKIKVKASTDPVSKQVVDSYDEWYEQFNLEDLMRERMSQKEKKRGGGGKGGGASRRSSAANSQSSRNTPSAAPRGQRPNRLRDNMHLLDPQLGHRLRSEPLSRSGTPGSAFSLDSLNRSFLPNQMGHLTYNGMSWGPDSVDDDYSPRIKQESFDSSESDDDYDDAYGLPTTRSSGSRRRTHRQHYPSESIASFNDDNNSLDGMANDHTKLKGVFWPGMDMFDSATAEMRRKRNQKKHSSVLESLQATSEIVEPTECVFDREGVLRKEREITGNIDSEDSLIEGESEPEPAVQEKKRARRRPRPALQNKNVNTGRAERSRRQSHHPPFGRDRIPSYPNGADDDDNDLTYGKRRPKKRSGLSIHRDNTGPDITFDNPPRPMHYLTFGRGGLGDTLHGSVFQNQQDSFVPRSHPSQSSWGQVNAAFRPAPGARANNPFFQPTAAPSLNAMPSSAGHNPLVGLGQQYSMSHQPPTAHAQNPLFQAATSNSSWDFLGLDHSDFSMVGGDSAFNLGGENTNTTSALFFSPTKVEEEDDNATISAKSDH